MPGRALSHPYVLASGNRRARLSARISRRHRHLRRLEPLAGEDLSGIHEALRIEKRENIRYVFSDDDLEVMDRIRRVFDPQRLMNPGKVFPGEGLKPSQVPMPPGYPRRQPGAAIAAGEDVWV